jgi:hypothetical protein
MLALNYTIYSIAIQHTIHIVCNLARQHPTHAALTAVVSHM